MRTREIITVREIIQRGGGPRQLAERSRALAGKGRCAQEIAAKTIYSWLASGIPEKHWGLVISECDVTPQELHQANETARAENGRCRAA